MLRRLAPHQQDRGEKYRCSLHVCVIVRLKDEQLYVLGLLNTTRKIKNGLSSRVELQKLSILVAEVFHIQLLSVIQYLAYAEKH